MRAQKCTFVEGLHSTPDAYARARAECGCSGCESVMRHRAEMFAQNPSQDVPMQVLYEEVRSLHDRVNRIERLNDELGETLTELRALLKQAHTASPPSQKAKSAKS